MNTYFDYIFMFVIISKMMEMVRGFKGSNRHAASIYASRTLKTSSIPKFFNTGKRKSNWKRNFLIKSLSNSYVDGFHNQDNGVSSSMGLDNKSPSFTYPCSIIMPPLKLQRTVYKFSKLIICYSSF